MRREREREKGERFTWRIPDRIALVTLPVLFKNINSSLLAAHIRSLSDELRAGFDQSLGLLAGDFVLCRRGERDVDLLQERPWSFAVNVLDAVFEVGGGGDFRELLALNFELGDQLHLGW